MRNFITSILILNLLHLPVPCPDLDGENRGVPIVSLAEAHAWHTLILGVLPNDDIDRGPFRSDDSGRTEGMTESPFGEICIQNQSVSVPSLFASNLVSWTLPVSATKPTVEIRGNSKSVFDRSAVAPYSVEHCAKLCVWLI